MNTLVVAHPDDEIIWFSPQSFDLIIIVFMARHDKPYAKYYRELALSEHPLREKMLILNLDESGFWKDKARVSQHQVCKKKLYSLLSDVKQKYPITKIFTHNSQGEYGHDDHILVHEVVISLFEEIEIFCPIESDVSNAYDAIVSIPNDIDFYKQVKAVYCKNKAWTWQDNYLPPSELYYLLHVKSENDIR